MRTFAKIIHLLITVLVVLYLLTGLGITNYQLVTLLTGGILDKAMSFQIHSRLFWPFIVVLVLHIGLKLSRSRSR